MRRLTLADLTSVNEARDIREAIAEAENQNTSLLLIPRIFIFLVLEKEIYFLPGHLCGDSSALGVSHTFNILSANELELDLPYGKSCLSRTSITINKERTLCFHCSGDAINISVNY